MIAKTYDEYLKLVLYIPIWLYSNFAVFCNIFFSFNFTFQSGYIPILLTSCKVRIWLSLHSNLVIFQSFHYNNTYLQTLKDTFCRPLFLSSFYFIIFRKLFLLSLFRPLQYWLCLSPTFQVYHRLTIVLVSLIFYIYLLCFS